LAMHVEIEKEELEYNRGASRHEVAAAS
jgi:hypothetical protein